MSENTSKHAIIIEDRCALTISGVIDVENFNEEIVVVETNMGIVTINGSNFRINKLNVEDGRLHIEGDIDGINYTVNEKKKKESLFSRIFK